MIRDLPVMIIFFICCAGCAHTLTAPLKPLEKSESKHTIYMPLGYQYQIGISDKLELGLDLSISDTGGNLRYHLMKDEKSYNSIQFGLDITGAIVNYMYTTKIKPETYLRLGPQLSYQAETARFSGSEKTYRTTRLGASLTFGGKHWWMTLGYSSPISKNYGDIRFRPFSSPEDKLLYGNPIFSPEYKFGYCF